jgi:hypothetical protein
MKWFSILIFMLSSSHAAEVAKSLCTAKDLARRDCRLSSAGTNVRLLPESLAWYDGTWHTVEPMPLKGQQSDWEKIEFQFLGGRPILQLWLWDKGTEVTGVQSLHWLTGELQKRKFKILAEGVVRKRRPKAKDALAAETKTQYLYDAFIEHSLKTSKNGDLDWSLGIDKKTLPRNDHGI